MANQTIESAQNDQGGPGLARSSGGSGPAAPSSDRPSRGGAGLDRGAVGFAEVLFQALATIGPAVGAAFGIPLGAAYAGGSLPLAVMIATGLCLTVAVSVGELARHLPSAGGVYTFVSRGIGPRAGFFVAWTFATFSLVPIAALQLGISLAGLVAAPDTPMYTAAWVGGALGLVLAVMLLGYFGLRVSTRAGALLALFEIVVFAALSAWLIARAGSANSLRPFGPSLANVPEHEGVSGLVVGVLYSISALTGFDSGTPLAEETPDPRYTIRRATVWACVAGGIFYVFTTYAATVGYGMETFAGFARLDEGTPWIPLARSAWGGAWVLVFGAIFISIIANQNAWANVYSRVLYSLARIRLLPGALEHTHARFRSPHVAVLVVGAMNAVSTLGFGLGLGPASALTLLFTICGAVSVMIYLLLNVACFLFYFREHRSEFSVLRHGLAPLVGVLAFVPVLMASLGIGSSRFSFIQPLTGIARLTGPVLSVWLALCVACYLWLARRHPDRLRATGRIFLDEGDEPAKLRAKAVATTESQ